MNAANKGRDKKKIEQNRQAAIVQFLVAPPWIAPQLRAQGHVEARRQKVFPIRGHAAKDRLAIRRDAAARSQWLAADGAGAAEVLVYGTQPPLWIAPQLRAQGHVKAQRQVVARLCGHAAKDRLAIRRDAAARSQWLAAVGAGAAEVLVYGTQTPLWIAPQLRAQGHVEAQRQVVAPLRRHAAKDRLAVRRDAAARRQWLAAVGVRAAEVLDLLWRRAIKRASLADRCLVTSPLPATNPEHSEPGGAGVRRRGALSGGAQSRGARGAGAEPSGAKGSGFESFRSYQKQEGPPSLVPL